MDTLTLALKKLNAVVWETPVEAALDNNPSLVLTLNANLMSLGYCLSPTLFNTLNRMAAAEVALLGEEMLSVLKTLKGSDVKHQALYPNFPQQVICADDFELYLNAILHYFSLGTWQPDYRELPRKFAFEYTKFQTIEQISVSEFQQLFSTLLSSRDSLSADDKAIVQWFLREAGREPLALPEEIPFHENKCLVSAHWLGKGIDITPLIKTSTDVLRLVTHLSKGDVSLAENTKFRSLKRAWRKRLVLQLERVINEEDIGRHLNKWVRVFHNLHVGDYAKLAPKTYAIATKARNGERLHSFYSDVELALMTYDISAAIKVLRSRPGEFARRLDHLLRVAQQCDIQLVREQADLPATEQQAALYHQMLVVESFLQGVDKIPSRNLTQLLGHLKTRFTSVKQRVVYPKGSLQKAVLVATELPALEESVVNALIRGVENSLSQRFSALPALGKVWIDPALKKCPLPTQQRSTSDGLFAVARGTRIPLAESREDTIRLFIYWIGMDIDLSATFHAEDGRLLEHVSYTHLRSGKYNAYHSGDITRAPNGASEFIDIDIPSAAKHARYLAMNVMVFNGPSFAEHKACFVGWMLRKKPNHNAIYEPATVQQKLNLTQRCRAMIPVLFDLQLREVVWTDLPILKDAYGHGNNVRNNSASIQDKLNAIVNTQNRLSLYDLFRLHALGRGELVDNQAAAETVFGMNAGITPFHVNEINANYLV
jgi:hypothetical protein